MAKKRNGRKLLSTELTWEERNPTSYLFNTETHEKLREAIRNHHESTERSSSKSKRRDSAQADN